MRTATSDLTLLQPRSLDEALRMMRDEGPLVPMAGCTDLYVSFNFGTLEARRFIDISRLETLRRVEVRNDVLSIGATATYTEVIRSRAVQERLPMLVSASREIGGIQIQNRGTVAGNVANGSPAGDTLPVLAAAEAVVVLQGTAGERRIPFASFYTGYRRSVMRPDELIVRIDVPPVPGAQWFRKVGTRAAQAISKIVMAGVRAPQPRIALGSVGPTVLRAPRTERALASGAAIDEAREILLTEIAPIDDLRSTARYRRAVAANLLTAFWNETGAA